MNPPPPHHWRTVQPPYDVHQAIECALCAATVYDGAFMPARAYRPGEEAVEYEPCSGVRGKRPGDETDAGERIR